MKLVNKFSILCGLTIFPLALTACGGEKAPKAGPESVVAKPRPPILNKYDAAAKLAEEQKFAAAGQAFMSVFQEQNKLTHALYNSGACFEMAGEIQRARTIYQKYLELQPTDKNGLMGLIRTSMASGELDSLLSKVEQQLATNPTDADLLLSKATLLRLLKRPEEAINVARNIILRNQKNLDAMKLIGMSYVDLNQLDMATTFFNNALTLAPEDNSLRDNIGIIQFNRGDHNEALATFNNSVTQGNDAVATANIGLIALKFRDYQKAQESLSKAIESGLKNCQTYKALGYANEGLQQGDEAVKALKSANNLCGKDIELLYDMAKIYNVLIRDYNQAKPLYNQYIAQNGKRTEEAKNALDVIAQIEASQQQMDNLQDGTAN